MKSIKHFSLIGILLLLLFIPLFNFFHPGIPLTHDGQDHVVRIANFYQNLQEGIFVPRWAENLNWGYGHPVMMFLYPLPSYLASLFHFIGFSFVDSTKLVFAFSFVASGVTMYLWLRSFLSDKAAFVGAALYAYAPYHFVDLYIRGAIGELVAFIFPPLVLFFLFKLSQKNAFGFLCGGSLSLAGFILAHNAVSLMFLPLLFFYMGFLIWLSSEKKTLIRNFALVLFFGFTLSAFFWLPAFVEGKYTLRDIVTKSEYENRFSNFSQIIYSPWRFGESGTFTVQVGIVQWLAVIATIPLMLHLRKKKNKNWLLLGGFFFIFLISIFLITPFSRFIWDKITLLQKFQFPWRFLFLSMFTTAVLGAFVFSVIPNKFQKLALIIFIGILLLLSKDMFYPRGYLLNPESFYTSIYNGTTDTGESAPIWSVRFMEQRPKAYIEVIDGEASITERSRMTTQHIYEVSVISENVQIRENTLYFPGWTVLVDGKPIPVQFQDPNNRGLMTFFLEKGSHTVEVVFNDTRLRTVANMVSISSLFVLSILGILGRRRLWQN